MRNDFYCSQISQSYSNLLIFNINDCIYMSKNITLQKISL